jgi:hypothetical protein
MDDGARAAVAQQLGLASMSFVMSPALAASYGAYLNNNNHNAANHDIAIIRFKADTQPRAGRQVLVNPRTNAAARCARCSTASA